MKRAFFVIGAESAGTKMLTRALISAGCWGSDEHKQLLDNLVFSRRPNVIVFRRSLPHNSEWPDIIDIQQNIKKAGYDLTTVAIVRDPRIVLASQLKRGHEDTEEAAKENIQKAMRIVAIYADELLHYHTFVTDAWYRKERFEDFGLSEPNMLFFDGNEKYEHLL